MSRYTKHFSTRETPQSEAIPGKPMVENSAGGFSFQVDCWKRLERFLILGNEGGSYYATEKKMTVDNAKCVLECAALDIKRTVKTIVDISVAGRATKNDPAVFSLGLLSKYPEALEAMPKVCRIGTHLFQFVEAAQANRGWGRSLKRAVQNWYLDKTPREVAYQVTKYQQRDGMSQRDILRLAKPAGATGDMKQIFAWITGKTEGHADYEPVKGEPLEHIYAFERAKHATDKHEIVRLITDHGLVRECIPTQFLNEPEVWEALLINMPLTALVRNLGKMTSIGLLKPLSGSQSYSMARDKLANVEAMKKARVHPIALLLAQSVYAQGHGDKGKLTWQPVAQIIDGLQEAFYAAFDAVEPTGKNWLLALDVSGSMGCSYVSGTKLSCREASGAMALVTASTEPNYQIVGFTGRGFSVGRAGRRFGSSSGVELLKISPKMRLDYVVSYLDKLPMGPTDCALPMLYATENKLKVDAFVVYTDSETWHGTIHPCQALEQYRQKMGVPAKLIVCSMEANKFSIADPNDAGMLDVVGFDTNVPSIMTEFVK